MSRETPKAKCVEKRFESAFIPVRFLDSPENIDSLLEQGRL